MSHFGGKATVVLASDYVSTFRGEWVEPDLVAVPVGLRFYVFRERLMADPVVGGDRPQRLAGGVPCADRCLVLRADLGSCQHAASLPVKVARPGEPPR
jgi:hypothetical protein